MSDDKTNPPLPGPAGSGVPSGTSTRSTGLTGTGLTGTGLSNPGSSRPTTAVMTGTRIMGTYEIEQLISKGGMGEVYRGHNIHTGDPVAIKIVLPHLAQEEMIVALFQKEAKVLGRLAHDAIVRYHVFTNDPDIGRPSLIMEFVEGTSMNDRMKQGPMPEDQVRVLLRRLAGGLEKAHGVGVVHRDLSPDNVILEGGTVEHAKIIDFGIAKSSMKGDATLLQGQFAGKFSFVAPEQLGAFGGEIDGRTDIYSLALMMVAACQGRALNMGKSIVEAVRARNAVPDLATVYPGLRPLLEHMLEPNPANRPDSMGAVIRLIDNPGLVPGRAAEEDDDDGDRTRIVSASAIAAQAAAAGSAPKGSLPRSQPAKTQKGAANEMFVGIPSGTTAKKEEIRKSGKGGLIAVLLVLVVIGGGAGAYFGGLFDGLIQTAGSDNPPKNPTVTPTEKPPVTPTEKPPVTPTVDPPVTPTEKPPVTPTVDPPVTPTEKPPVTPTEDPPVTPTVDPPVTPTVDPPVTPTEDPPVTPTADPPVVPETTDPLASQFAWLAKYQAGECVFLAPQQGADGTVVIDGFGTTVGPFSKLLREYSAANGVEPKIDVHIIGAPQCPVLDLMNALRDTKAIPIKFVLDKPKSVLKSGEPLTGRIDGLAGRVVSLFNVNGFGGTTSLKKFLVKGADGTVTFSFKVNQTSGAEPTPQLILAVVTDEAVTKLDAIPSGVTARALVPFMLNEIKRARQDPAVALLFFRLES